MKLYDVIMADPPWKFQFWSPAQEGTRRAENHYPVMELEHICKLPVAGLAADNCVLFLWSVWPLLYESKEVIDAWGFEYKTIAWVWVKSKSSGFGFFTGMGFYTRSNTEPCLLAIKGSMPVSAHDIQALIYSPIREHSRKPDEQYRKIERLYPGKRYLELFARHKRPGWDSWGNEISSDVEIPILLDLTTGLLRRE